MNRQYRIAISTVEIISGLLLVTCCCLLMLQSILNRDTDVHGFGIFLGIFFGLFGTGVGALLAFAGAVLRQSSKFGLLSHFPLIIYTGIGCFVYFQLS